MMNGKDREVLRSWLENLKQQRVERKKLKQARCQYSPHLEKLANFLPIQKPGTNLQPIQKRKSDATGTDLQPIPLKISRASPSVTRPATRSHPPRLEPLQEMFTQAPHLKLLNDPPITIAPEVPEVQEIPVVQEKPEVIEIPESPSFGCTAAGQPFGHLDPGSQEPLKKLGKGHSVQHISGGEKAVFNKVDTRQYNQTLVTLPAMLSRAPHLEHLPEKRTHAPHLVQLLNDLPIPEAPEVPVVQEAPQTPEVQEISVVPELHKIPESSLFRCTAAEQPSGHLDPVKVHSLQHISGGEKAILQKVYYRQYKRQCELMNVDTIRHVGVTLRIDMDIHNRLLEMKMTLNLRTISDVLYFLLESYEIAKESEVQEQIGECTTETSRVHVASRVPQYRDRIPCRSQESSNYVTQSQIPSCSSQGVMPDHYTQCQANLNFIASGAPRGLITKRITQFQTNQVEKNRCDKEAADKAPSFNIPEEPRVHGEKRKRLKSPDILEKIEKNLKRSAKLVNQEPQVQGEKHESLQRTDILEQIENNLKRSANLVKQLEHERPFKVKLEDGTEEMDIAGKDKDYSNIHDVPSEDPNCANSSNTSKDDQANQKETPELILPGNHDSSLIAQSQSLTPYVVFRPSEIRIPNTICQTVTVAVPITEYETGQDDKDDEDSDDSIPEDASPQDVNCEESISEDAFTQDVNYQSMPSKYVLQKLRNKVQQRAKSMEGDGPARNRELGDSTIDQMVYDSTLEMAERKTVMA
ncbi:uncharacterized protein [Amphiura filiformis]|uniref:uncharacterized protein n=1 Tax=Amphiura filiformis TaxID=82378 RepID=UPI003B20EA9A